MGLLKKSKKADKKKKGLTPANSQELPKLPELPDFESSEKLSQLPQFPNDSFGEKFSQDIIKGAVTGKKEENEEEEANEFEPEREGQTMRQPLSNEKFEHVPATFREAAKKMNEPIFVRIDKFEEGLHAFEKAKQQITEIEKMLRDVKNLKEEEEKELSLWEREVQKTKQEIEKIDQDIFSKIE